MANITKIKAGKRAEYYILSMLLKENYDCYMPVSDDDGVDIVVRLNDKKFISLQIKSTTKDIKMGDAAFFAAIKHDKIREDYYFIFYSERMETIWVMSSEEFIKKSTVNKKGKNKGSRTIRFNITCKKEEKIKEEYRSFMCKDFSFLRDLP